VALHDRVELRIARFPAREVRAAVVVDRHLAAVGRAHVKLRCGLPLDAGVPAGAELGLALELEGADVDDLAGKTDVGRNVALELDLREHEVRAGADAQMVVQREPPRSARRKTGAASSASRCTGR
jgi:hypothetical protein